MSNSNSIPTTLPSIPFDVLDLILEFVAFVPGSDAFEQANKSTISSLAAWRLTCRYFDSIVRPRLWRVIALDDKDSKIHRFEEMRRLLDVHPEIGAFVQSFALKTTPGSTSARNNPPLIKILPQFTKLKNFQFECSGGVFRWIDLDQEMGLEFEKLCQLSTVSTIELRGVKDVPPSLILSCKSLKRLLLRDVFFDSSIDRLQPGDGTSAPPKIQNLELWPRVTSSDILVFNALDMFSTVERLMMSVFDHEDLQIALAVTTSARKTVRHLKIGGTYLLDRKDEAWKCQLDLEQLINLEHIHTYCVMDTDAYAAKRFPKNLIVLLDRSQPSFTVKTLHIYLKVYVLGTELMLHLTDGWEGLDDIVMTKYPNLQVLRLEFISLFSSAPKEDEGQVKIHIRNMLPRTTAAATIKLQIITDTGVVWDL